MNWMNGAVIGLLIGIAGTVAYNYNHNMNLELAFNKQQGAIEVFRVLCPMVIQPFEAKGMPLSGKK